MNIQKVLLSMVLMASASGIHAMDSNSSQADMKSNAAGFRFSESEKQFVNSKGERVCEIAPPEQHFVHKAVGWEKMDANHKAFLDKMDNWSANPKDLKRCYPLPDHRSFSIKDETIDKIIGTVILAAVTGVLRISYDWLTTSKQDVQARRTGITLDNLAKHEGRLASQYKDITYQRTVIAGTRKIAANMKEAEARKALLEQCEIREKELDELQCRLNEAIFKFSKTRDEFFNPSEQPTKPAHEAKQALTQQVSAKKIEAAPAA